MHGQNETTLRTLNTDAHLNEYENILSQTFTFRFLARLFVSRWLLFSVASGSKY